MRYYEKILHDIIYVLNYVRSTYIRKLYKLRDEKKNCRLTDSLYPTRLNSNGRKSLSIARILFILYYISIYNIYTHTPNILMRYYIIIICTHYTLTPINTYLCSMTRIHFHRHTENI